MNFCTKCGIQLKPGARFCGSCGHVVTIETKLSQALTTPEPLCTQCGARLTPGVKFCVDCGAPADIVLQPGHVPPPPPVSANPTPASQPPVTSKPVKKKSHKVVKIIVAFLTLVVIGVAALYYFGMFKPKESYTDRSALLEDEKYDPVQIEKAATTVESVFAASDTVGLAKILSPTSLEQRRQYFAELMPHMPAFAADFKTRKLLYATPRFGVFEFNSAEGKFTADFCLGEDGTWKLMRF